VTSETKFTTWCSN